MPSTGRPPPSFHRPTALDRPPPPSFHRPAAPPHCPQHTALCPPPLHIASSPPATAAHRPQSTAPSATPLAQCPLRLSRLRPLSLLFHRSLHHARLSRSPPSLFYCPPSVPARRLMSAVTRPPSLTRLRLCRPAAFSFLPRQARARRSCAQNALQTPSQLVIWAIVTMDEEPHLCRGERRADSCSAPIRMSSLTMDHKPPRQASYARRAMRTPARNRLPDVGAAPRLTRNSRLVARHARGMPRADSSSQSALRGWTSPMIDQRRLRRASRAR